MLKSAHGPQRNEEFHVLQEAQFERMQGREALPSETHSFEVMQKAVFLLSG